MEEIVLIGICLILNGLLAAVEMAFVSVSRPQLRAYAAKGSKHANSLLLLRQKPERILSILQIGITLVGTAAAAVSGVGAEEVLSPWIQNKFKLDENAAEFLSLFIVVLPLTYVSVVFGELVPKAISLKKPYKIALVATPWLRFFDNILSPAVSALEKSTQLVVRAFFKSSPEVSPSTEDILEMAELQTHTRQYILNLVHAEKRRAEDVMVTWDSVNFVKKGESIAEVEKVIMDSGHTRLPVMDVEVTNVLGLIHSKELLRLIESGEKNWFEHIRPILRVRGREPILDIFLKMQQNRSHLAVVYDRMNIIGIITLEDIVEEVMGDLFDEDDDQKIRKLLSTRNKK